MPRMGKKSELPAKAYAACGQFFSWGKNKAGVDR